MDKNRVFSGRITGVAAAAILLLQGCAGTSLPGIDRALPERRAEALADAGRHDDAASTYIGLASEARGGERQRLTLLAVEQWLDAGDGRRARSAMAAVSDPVEPTLQPLMDSNRAALALWQGRPDDALDILRPLSSQPLPAARRIRVDALRGDAWFQKSEPARAVNLYLQLEQALSAPDDITAARERLWAGLTVSDPQKMRTAARINSSGLIRGWLALGALAVSTGQRGIGWNSGFERWQLEYPTHPAASIVADFAAADPGLFSFPRQVALLVPLSGNAASIGQALQNGFLAGYFESGAHADGSQELRVYDLPSEQSAAEAYQRAVADGAEFVVGPLLRRSVEELAALPSLPVPVLALNNLRESTERPPGLFQFALAPEDEAITAARRTIADGHSLGVALIPDSDWGRRMLQSFVTEFEGRGGQLLEYRYYQPSDQDFSFEIENIMGLALSVDRFNRLRANLGRGLRFDPRRRGDAEFVFLAAAAPAGRLMKSQLKFHYSGDLPVYATSRIFADDGRSNSDLNGVGFADTPWTIAPQPRIAALPATFDEYWPEGQSLLLSRLNAMGYDAYTLVNELHSGGFEAPIEGASGTLLINPQGRVRRELPWAVFENGEPVPAPWPSDDSFGDDSDAVIDEGADPLDASDDVSDNDRRLFDRAWRGRDDNS